MYTQTKTIKKKRRVTSKSKTTLLHTKNPQDTHTLTQRRKITASETQNHSNAHTHTTKKTYQIPKRGKVD